MKISCIQMDMRLGEVDYNFAHAEALIRRTAAQHGGTILLEHPEDCGTRITMTLAIRQNTETIVSSPTFRLDYAGGRDRRLLEYADSLPAKLYDAKLIN